MRGELEKWRSVVGEKKEKEIKELEAEAAGEDLEFKKHENLYFDAEKSLEEFFGHTEKIGLEKDKKEKFEDLMDGLVELHDLLKNKNYESFKNKYVRLYDNLKRLSSEVEQESKEKQKDISDENLAKLEASLSVEKEQPEKEKKAAVKAIKTVVAKTEKEEQKEQEQRDRLYYKHEESFWLLSRIIRGVDRDEKGKRKLIEKYGKQMKTLQAYLNTADQTRNPKVFHININNFNNDFKELIANLEPDLKEIYEHGGVLPKEKKEERKAIPELEPEPEKPESKVEISQEYLQEVATKKETPVVAVKPPTELPAKPAPKAPETEQTTPPLVPQETPKKSLWGRLKDAIFHPETKKVAKKVTYDTVTSVLGIKLATDAVRWLAKGEGDLAEWWEGRRESKSARDAITMAYQDLMESLKKGKENKVLEEYEKIENRIANFKAKVESAHITPEAKKALLDRLLEIATKHQEGAKAAVKDRDKEVRRVLDAYLQAKVSGMKIARDALNFALTAAGLSMLRGLAYAGASIAERAGKARKEYTKQTVGARAKKAELGFVAKDIFVNSAIETARALSLRGEKEGAGATRKTIDFIKAIGTVARGFGIYGLAVSGAELPSQSIDKLINQIKEQGVAGAVADNFIQNTERVWHLYTHPTEIFKGRREAEPQEIPSTPEPPPTAKPQEVPIPVEAPLGFSADQFTVENKLSPEFSRSLQNLVKEYPELNNQESVQKILNASQIGPDTRSHHETILKGTIDTLDESGGERRQVIFEELLKKGGPQSATEYLQSQHFSSRHLSYLSNYIRKGTPDEYLKFAEKYDEKNARMVSGVFRAMQGRESTDLANAGLEVDATSAKPGIDNHVHGKVSYFGLKNGEPVLSGNGSVTVDQMEKTLTTYKASESTPVVESAPVAAPLGSKLVVPPVEKNLVAEKVSPAPEIIPEQETVGQFLKEHNSNPKEFVATYDKMIEATADRLNDKLILRGDAADFLQNKIKFLYHNTGITEESFKINSIIDSENLSMMKKVLDAENKFKLNQSDWMRAFNQTMFSESDKDISLALAPDRDVQTYPIVANGGHAARIWDSARGKDIFIYDKDSVYSTNKDGQLVEENKDGRIWVHSQKEIIKMSKAK